MKANEQQVKDAPAGNFFKVLLYALDRDENEAGRIYETIRERLISLFLSRQLSNLEEYADEVFNRVAKKLVLDKSGELFYEKQGGLERLDRKEFLGFIIRVAQLLAREKFKQEKKLEITDWQTNFQPPSYDPEKLIREREIEIQAELKFKFQQKCLAELSAEDRRLLTEYTLLGENAESGSDKRAKREQMAKKNDLTILNLRTRISRMREKLADCVKNLLKNV